MVHRHPAHRVTRGRMLWNGRGKAGDAVTDGFLQQFVVSGVCHIKKLMLDDIDTFKVRAMFRLEQPDLPRTRF